jgi:hypothetical protein
MIEQLTDLPENVLGIEANGEVTDDDYDNVLIPAVEAHLEDHDRIRLLYVMGDEFDGYTMGAMWDDTKLGFKHPRSWEKIAIVTDDTSMLRMMKMFGWMVPGEFKTFGVGDLDAAKEWVSS